jgi:tripartite-type tricarboxylate transporter receptor subunit TctC
VADFVARAKANPGKLNYAHGGLGSPLHLGAAQFVSQTGIDVPAVPYKGSGAALPDVASGRVEVLFAGYSGGAPYLQGGKLKPLGVTGTQRLAALPDVPTFKEQGVAFTYYFWLGLLAPAGTPKEAVQKLAEALKYATSSKELTERFRAEGSEPMPASPEEFNAYLAKEVADTARLMRDQKVQKE